MKGECDETVFFLLNIDSAYIDVGVYRADFCGYKLRENV